VPVEAWLLLHLAAVVPVQVSPKTPQ
jgi:hypothetical protein